MYIIVNWRYIFCSDFIRRCRAAACALLLFTLCRRMWLTGCNSTYCRPTYNYHSSPIRRVIRKYNIIMDASAAAGEKNKVKRQRKANWRQDSCLMLLQLISEKKTIIEGKKFDTDVTAKVRREAWEEITRKLNAAYPDTVRMKSEVEKKWWALKSQGREELCGYKKTLQGTGKNPYFSISNTI